MKKYHTLLVVSIAILFVALLTWFLPITYYSNGMISGDKAQLGIVNLFTYPFYTFYNFIYVVLFLLFVGGLYGLLSKIDAYRVILDRVVDHVKERKILVLILVILLTALVVSFTGYTYEVLLLLPFIASVVLLLGYDKMTAAMITIGSISVGVIGSTFSDIIVGSFNETLELAFTDLILVKVILLVVCSILLIGSIILYNVLRNRRGEKSESIDDDMLIPSKVRNKNVKVCPLATIMILTLLILVLARVNWKNAFGITFFEDALTTINSWPVLSKYVLLVVCGLGVLYNVLISLYRRKKLAKNDEKLMSKKRKIVTIVLGVIACLALLKVMLEDVFNVTHIMNTLLEEIKISSFIDEFTFEKLLGSTVAFGSWSNNDYLILLLVSICAIKFTYHIKFEEVIDNLGAGFKKVLYACIVVMLGYTLLIVASSHPIGLTIIKPLLELTDGLNVLTYPLCALISGLFSTDFTYFEYGVLNLTYAVDNFTSAGALKIVELITQSMYGFAMLIAPTSAILLFGLSFLNIKYTTWLKKNIIFIASLFVVLYVTFFIVKLCLF